MSESAAADAQHPESGREASSAATRHLTGERDADLVRRKLELALVRIPTNGLIFTRSEVDRIADALGGYTELLEVINAED